MCFAENANSSESKMRVTTQDPKQLAACLTRLMATTESRDLARQAENLADMLDAMVTPSPEVVGKAQLLLERHGIGCPGAEDA